MATRTPASWAPPGTFDEYHLVRPLGQGGMGQVYLAHDALLDRMVAIKFLSAVTPGSVARERFLVEARAAARLSHPNVLQVYRVGELQGHAYLVTEFIRGESLDRMQKPVPWARALDIALALVRGLA